MSQIPVAGGSDFIAVGAGKLWVPGSRNGTLIRIDPVERRVDHDVQVEADHAGRAVSPFSVAIGAGRAWLTKTSKPYALISVDLETDRVMSIPLDVVPYAVAASDDMVWVSSREADKVLAVDVASAAMVGEATVARPTGVAWDSENVWVVSTTQRSLIRLGPDLAESTVVAQVGADTQTVAVGFGYIWTGDGGSSGVTRVEPASGRADFIETASGTWAVAVGERYVWAGSYSRAQVYRIEPKSADVIETIGVPGVVNSVAATGSDVFVASYDANAVFVLAP